MAFLANYLRTQRKRSGFSQEEVAFLMGVNGADKGTKVCRHENDAREPSLQDALAYEIIYDKPVRELFGGFCEKAKQKVTARAKLLKSRSTLKPRHRESLINLITRLQTP